MKAISAESAVDSRTRSGDGESLGEVCRMKTVADINVSF
jgi:hypothetical protein